MCDDDVKIFPTFKGHLISDITQCAAMRSALAFCVALPDNRLGLRFYFASLLAMSLAGAAVGPKERDSAGGRMRCEV